MKAQDKIPTTRVGRFVAGNREVHDNLLLLRGIGKDGVLRALRSRLTDVRSEDHESVTDIAKETNVSPEELAGATAAAVILLGYDFGDQESPDAEDHKEVMADLASAGAFDKDAAREITGILDGLSQEEEIRRGMQDRIRAERNIARAFPTFKGMWTSCAVLQQFEQEFSATDDPDDYNPRIETPIPVLNIQIDVNFFGSTKRTSFGVSREELQRIIRRLQLASKQLRAVADAVDQE